LPHPRPIRGDKGGRGLWVTEDWGKTDVDEPFMDPLPFGKGGGQAGSDDKKGIA
jgi:hypothetical protein